jgi:FkbM family methyltransferase
MVNKLTLLRTAERVAKPLRKIGLGPLIDKAAGPMVPHLGQQDIAFDGFTIHCEHLGHLYYMRDLLEDEHDVYFRELFVAATPPGGTVLEAGAHLGVMTLVAARAAGPSGHVYTFEPNPDVLPILRRNVANNGYAESVTIIDRGVSSEAATLTFFISGGGETSSLHDPGTASHSVTITTVPADDYFPADATVDVIKLDIEGNEVAAVRGMEQLLRRSVDKVTVFAECNPAMLKQAGTTPEELILALENCGLNVQWIDDVERRVRPLDDEMYERSYVNLICRRDTAVIPDTAPSA